MQILHVTSKEQTGPHGLTTASAAFLPLIREHNSQQPSWRGLNLWGLLTKTRSVQKLFTGNTVGWSWSWIVKNDPCEWGSWAVVMMQVRLNGDIFRIHSFVTPQVAGITFVNSLIKQNMLILWNANLYYVMVADKMSYNSQNACKFAQACKLRVWSVVCILYIGFNDDCQHRLLTGDFNSQHVSLRLIFFVVIIVG